MVWNRAAGRTFGLSSRVGDYIINRRLKTIMDTDLSSITRGKTKTRINKVAIEWLGVPAANAKFSSSTGDRENG